jgi:hypothetical protein
VSKGLPSLSTVGAVALLPRYLSSKESKAEAALAAELAALVADVDALVADVAASDAFVVAIVA